tara:strand:+ start:132 stop:332 length:201 start_codon:yes stop_codon:yes gene_type:complete
MKVFEDTNLLENVFDLGKYIVSELNKLNKLSNVRGLGLFIAFDFESSKIRGKYDELCFQERLFCYQ